MKKKNLNKVISLALAALCANSCVSAKKKYQRKQSNLGNWLFGGACVTSLGIAAYKANEAGLLPFENKIPDKKPDLPDYTPAPGPQELPFIPKEKPALLNMYQRACDALKEEGLTEYCKNWFSAINLTTGKDGTIYLGTQGIVRPFEDDDKRKEKAFLANSSNKDRMLDTCLCNWGRDRDNQKEEANKVFQLWNQENANHDAGEKYNTLVKLIGLPVDNENDIIQLAQALRDNNVVNEKECISVGVTKFSNKQNRICVAMYGDRYTDTCKKMVTSDTKGLEFCFIPCRDTCLCDVGDSFNDEPDYYFITPTSVTRNNTNNVY